MDEQHYLNEINAIPWEQPAGNDDYRNALLVFADWLEERGDPRAELILLREVLLKYSTSWPDEVCERMQALIHEGVQPVVATWENSIGMKFCWCPPGSFLMGNFERYKLQFENNKEQVMVKLTNGFWFGKYEVMQGEYENLMGKNPSSFSATGNDKARVVDQGTSQFPVETVSWTEATEYCHKLTEHERVRG